MANLVQSNKALLVTNIPNPYRIPLFNELNKQLKLHGINFKVVFGALGYSRRKWKIDMTECAFDYEVLSSRKIRFAAPDQVIFTYGGLLSVLKKENPYLIITIGYTLATIKLWLRSIFIKTRYIIWSGAIFIKNRENYFLRRIQRRILVKRASGFIAYGKKAKEYLIFLGAHPKAISIGINTIDTEYFREETQRIRNSIKKNGKKTLLYVGHFEKRKRIDLLLKAIAILKQRRGDFVLRLIGEGSELKQLKAMASRMDLNDYVSFEGFKQKKEIPEYFAEADCFLFPSEYDIWGLVLVEAMSAGLPCISSIKAGATHDLIKDGVTGFVMDFSDIEKVAEKINWLLDNPELAREISQNASRFINENMNIKESAKGFVEAIIGILNKSESA